MMKKKGPLGPIKVIGLDVTWEHEKAEAVGLNKVRFRQLTAISGLPGLLKKW